LVISVKGTTTTGADLQKVLLEKYHIQLEMAAETYVLGIITMCDTQEGFDRLAQALLKMDAELSGTEERTSVRVSYVTGYPEEDIVYTLAEVREKDTQEVLTEDAEGRICADYVNLYPPGIPLILPGERIVKEHIVLINRYLEKGMHVQGVTERRLLVCCE
jgi:arginine/lysine/ornithine decarboxylase